jgi:hypothetical protein
MYGLRGCGAAFGPVQHLVCEFAELFGGRLAWKNGDPAAICSRASNPSIFKSSSLDVDMITATKDHSNLQIRLAV